MNMCVLFNKITFRFKHLKYGNGDKSYWDYDGKQDLLIVVNYMHTRCDRHDKFETAWLAFITILKNYNSNSIRFMVIICGLVRTYLYVALVLDECVCIDFILDAIEKVKQYDISFKNIHFYVNTDELNNFKSSMFDLLCCEFVMQHIIKSIKTTHLNHSNYYSREHNNFPSVQYHNLVLYVLSEVNSVYDPTYAGVNKKTIPFVTIESNSIRVIQIPGTVFFKYTNYIKTRQETRDLLTQFQLKPADQTKYILCNRSQK